MATPATPATNTMPLAEELGLVKYLSQITGFGTDKNAGTYTAATATAAQAPRLTSDDLSNIMTDWLRGNGQFLENMRSQNIAGLYNTSTRRLVANDLMAQAALKAAGANQQIDIQNANLATQTALQNARQADAASAVSAVATAQRGSAKSNARQNALAAAIAAYNKYAKDKEKGSNTKQGEQGTKTGSGDLTPEATGADQMQSFGGATDDFALATAQSMGNPLDVMGTAPAAADFSGMTPYGDFTSAVDFSAPAAADFGAVDTGNVFDVGSAGSPFQDFSTSFDTFDVGSSYDFGSNYGSYTNYEIQDPYSWVDAW